MNFKKYIVNHKTEVLQLGAMVAVVVMPMAMGSGVAHASNSLGLRFVE